MCQRSATHAAFSCPGRGPEDHEQLLKNSLFAASESIRDHKRRHFTAKSCSNLRVGTSVSICSGRRRAFFNSLGRYRTQIHISGRRPRRSLPGVAVDFVPCGTTTSRRRQERSASMVIVAGHITVEPQQREAYLAGCVSVVKQARGTAGCVDFAITADLIDPGRVNILERRESQAAVETFRSSSPSNEQGAPMLS